MRSSARADGSSGSAGCGAELLTADVPRMERRGGDRRGPAAFKTVGLTRRGPPTCRHRRESFWLARENPQSSRIPSHLSFRAKVGLPRRDSPTECGAELFRVREEEELRLWHLFRILVGETPTLLELRLC